MIPRANITAWRETVPWPDNTHVEQDLVLSRSLVELFSRPNIATRAVLRGGTALHKLFFAKPERYSEDIDLVQREAEPIGPLVGEIREVLDSWLGTPKWKAGHGRFTLFYRFDTTFTPVVRMRLKIEINTREHFTVHGLTGRTASVENPWFTGTAEVVTYTLPELLGTKLRALYQRKKGRDLFDLAVGLDHPAMDVARLLSAFEAYMAFGETPVTRAQFEENMAAKMGDPSFLDDVPTLLRTGIEYHAAGAWKRVHEAIITRLPGDPWKGVEAAEK